ncbi:FIP (Fungus-Induced Protein) Related [Caenorhabditis elegans]|uniref:FIP (Fungus-Induced Protein) Related n=1 Tax=Caenorhabditis elegans TaxID=6239 RepID=A0A2K5ATV0_CAEEL|nr:FIP (Fungus-Induced Protein) Related [Caenorhabditis elegans]SPC47543.1 FIP (Fungus-Induced Protein) Related [Caenorhabditis elegans]|eukprot:NP_001348748.1 Uncharacterized protein CELE_F54D8.10 [Caenorhabditis elegans]
MRFVIIPTVFFIISCIFSISNAQFFFPFAMGYQRPVASGYQYSNGNGVKSSDGFFPLCRGWTCTSNT